MPRKGREINWAYIDKKAPHRRHYFLAASQTRGRHIQHVWDLESGLTCDLRNLIFVETSSLIAFMDPRVLPRMYACTWVRTARLCRRRVIGKGSRTLGACSFPPSSHISFPLFISLDHMMLWWSAGNIQSTDGPLYSEIRPKTAEGGILCLPSSPTKLGWLWVV